METKIETTRPRPTRGNALRAARLVALLCLSGSAVIVASRARAQETESAGEEVRRDIREAHWRHPRLRLGFSGLGGGFFGGIHGGVGGLAVRAGVQLNDLVAVYLQAHGLLGEYVPDPRPSSLVGFVFHEGMLELTLLDMIQLGAGPSLDVFFTCDARNDGGYCGQGGAWFGGDFRFAVSEFHRRDHRRSGVVFSIDAHPTWMDHDLVTTMLFGIGGDLY